MQRLLEHGASVYLLQWENPGVDGQDFGLADYAGRCILDCLEAIAAERGPAPVFLAGHSLGGTLAAIFAALHPERVRGLVLLEAPLRFGAEADAFTPLLARAPRAQQLTEYLHEVPGSLLDVAAVSASPDSFVWSRWADWLHSLNDREALQTHAQVIRWTLDELAFPRRLFEDVVELLYREKRLHERNPEPRGTARHSGAGPGPAPQRGRPALAPGAAGSGAALPRRRRQRRCATAVVRGGDVGVALQHVGVLVGRRAHREVWPQILRWLDAHGEAG
ncbi:alpha/beta fold hydrolase [Azotobacter vinelandii]